MTNKELKSVKEAVRTSHSYVRVHGRTFAFLTKEKDFFNHAYLHNFNGDEWFFVEKEWLLETVGEQTVNFESACKSELQKFYKGCYGIKAIYDCDWTNINYTSLRASGIVTDPEDYFRHHTSAYEEDQVAALANDLCKNGPHVYQIDTIFYKRIELVGTDDDWAKLVNILDLHGYQIKYDNIKECYSVC